MRRSVVFAGFAAALLSGSALAETVVTISKSQQKLAVSVDGRELYRWPVSTGRRGLETPSGTFRPIRFERKWYSRKYDWAPMPYSVFFHGGYAMHGTTEKRRLGQPASHGCVRLLPVNAATLFDLLRRTGKGDTRIVVTNAALPPPGGVTLADIKVPLPPVHEPVFEKPVNVAAVKAMPRVEIKVPLPPVFEPRFAAPVKQAEIVVPLPPMREPEFDKPVKQAEIVVPLPPLHRPVFDKPVREAEIMVPLPPEHAPEFDAPPAAPKTVDASPPERSEPAAPPPQKAMTAMAHVPLPRLRAPEPQPAPRPVHVSHDDAGSFTSVGSDAEVMRGREAWLRSLDRKYGIAR